ncbi:MAG: AAA family ATPase [Chitinophagales bacterium]|nr:AAA family ATPase [Chitinophagales bacterium]
MSTFYIDFNDDKSKESSEFEISDNILGPINDVNIFVGANNSRKSRLLRQFYETFTYLVISNGKDTHNTKPIKDLLNKFQQYFRGNTIIEVDLSGLQGPSKIIDEYDLQNIKTLRDNNELNRNTFRIDPVELSRIYSCFKFKEGETQTSIIPLYINKLKALIEISKFIDIIKIDHKFKIYPKDAWTCLKQSPSERDLIKITKYSELVSNIEFKNTVEEIIKILEKYEYVKTWNLEYNRRVYIPILRSSITFFDSKDSIITDDIFSLTVKKLYKFKKPENKESSQFKVAGLELNEANYSHKIFTGRTLYDDILKYRNGKLIDRFQDFENFISQSFFDSKPLRIISYWDDKHIHIDFINEKDGRFLHEIGDGIQSLIILLFQVFMSDDETWFFIEEPELNLHPGFQRIFLETITSNPILKEKKHKYFFTTHSNHFLDISIENFNLVSIFLFNKVNKDQSKIRCVTPRDLEILNSLGVNNSSVFMANCSIWVEGITDRKYIQGFIKLFSKSNEFPYKEDIHYSFFEYGGSNIVHYDFNEDVDKNKIKALSLSNRILLISDDDESHLPKNKSKKERHEKFKEQLGNRFITTKDFGSGEIGGIEIENLLSPIILNRLLHTSEKLRNELLDLKFKDIEHDSYLNKRIGKFLNEEVLKGSKYASKEDSLSYKKKTDMATSFLEKVNKDEISWKDLGDIAQNFCIKIISHISHINKNNTI